MVYVLYGIIVASDKIIDEEVNKGVVEYDKDWKAV